MRRKSSWKQRILIVAHSKIEKIVFARNNLGSGSGASGRVTACVRAGPGLNPRTDLGFFPFRIAFNLFLLGMRLIYRLFPSSFLFPFIMYHCKIYQLQSNNVPKKEKNPKRLIKANIKNLLMHITSLCYSEQPIRCVSLGSKAMFPGSIGLTGTQNAQNESANLVSWAMHRGFE